MKADNMMRRFFGYAALALLQAVFVLSTTLIANAQTAAQKEAKAAETKTAIREAKAAPLKAPSSIAERFDKEGIAIDYSIKSIPGRDDKDSGLVAGTDALVTFRVTDARSGQAITGLHPNAWISARSADHTPNEAECKDKVRTFLRGTLSARADIDLNSYVLLTLNHDSTVTFVNPQISFNITKLESIITLPGVGSDWVLSKDKSFLYVTLPKQSSVAVINTVTRRLLGIIPTGEKTKPTRIALQPDGHYVWVGLDDSPLVAVINTETNKLASTVTVGAGLHNVAFTADSRFAYVTNSAADTVSVINIEKLSKTMDISVAKTPVPIAYSRMSRFIYVAAINGAEVAVIDPEKQQVVRIIPTRRGIVALRFEPQGRYCFAVNQVESTLTVIDGSTNTITGATEVVKGPDQVTFTTGYAYVHGTESEKFSLLELNDVRRGKFAPVNIQAGRLAPSAAAQDIAVGDMIAPTPEGNSVMIANTPDMTIYYYSEGLMAPMGTFSNYKRRPLALMLLDRSLAEVAPGVYSATVKLSSAGRFDVPILIDQPRVINCFQLDVGASPDGDKINAGMSITIEQLFRGKQFKAGEEAVLRFKITDSATKGSVKGLKDVHVLAFEPPGIWQQRSWAKEVGDGIYEVSQLFPQAGHYRVMIEVQSRGVRFADLPFAYVGVVKNAEPDQAKGASKKGESKNE